MASELGRNSLKRRRSEKDARSNGGYSGVPTKIPRTESSCCFTTMPTEPSAQPPQQLPADFYISAMDLIPFQYAQHYPEYFEGCLATAQQLSQGCPQPNMLQGPRMGSYPPQRYHPQPFTSFSPSLSLATPYNLGQTYQNLEGIFDLSGSYVLQAVSGQPCQQNPSGMTYSNKPHTFPSQTHYPGSSRRFHTNLQQGVLTQQNSDPVDGSEWLADADEATKTAVHGAFEAAMVEIYGEEWETKILLADNQSAPSDEPILGDQDGLPELDAQHTTEEMTVPQSDLAVEPKKNQVAGVPQPDLFVQPNNDQKTKASTPPPPAQPKDGSAISTPTSNKVPSSSTPGQTGSSPDTPVKSRRGRKRAFPNDASSTEPYTIEGLLARREKLMKAKEAVQTKEFDAEDALAKYESLHAKQIEKERLQKKSNQLTGKTKQEKLRAEVRRERAKRSKLQKTLTAINEELLKLPGGEIHTRG